MYQQLINQIDSTINPAGVEASMRLQYGTLDHLSRDDFRREIRLAHECEKAEPGYLKMVAKSYGMERDFNRWAKIAIEDECWTPENDGTVFPNAHSE